MQISNFAGKTIAIMVASGFDEKLFIAIQSAMLTAGAKLKIVSRDAGLTNAWNRTGWGMSYPVDATISTALAVDYDALIIPSGSRHVETLAGEVHVKRILRAFLRENMPVLLVEEAISLLDVVDVAAPVINDETGTGCENRLVVIKAGDQNISGIENLNGVMVEAEDSNVAA